MIAQSTVFFEEENKMLFNQELYLLWSALELFMAITHLFVFIGKSSEPPRLSYASPMTQ